MYSENDIPSMAAEIERLESQLASTKRLLEEAKKALGQINILGGDSPFGFSSEGLIKARNIADAALDRINQQEEVGSDEKGS